jgi:selenium metabolism protein YedF
MGKVVFLKSDRMGRANEDLGHVLLKNFLYSLARSEKKPDAVYMVNGGVKLACEGSQSIDDLFLLVEAGVPVYSCGTCLDYLGLKDTLRVGGVSRMEDLVAALMQAEDVLTLS